MSEKTVKNQEPNNEALAPTVDVDALRAQLKAEMEAEKEASLKEIKAEMEAKIRAELEAKTKTDAAKSTKAVKATDKPETNAYLEEYVPVFLFKDNDKYKDDVTVTVNGKNYQIMRGVNVMVPRKVKLILEQSHKQDMATASEVARLEKALRDKEKELGI